MRLVVENDDYDDFKWINRNENNFIQQKNMKSILFWTQSLNKNEI